MSGGYSGGRTFSGTAFGVKHYYWITEYYQANTYTRIWSGIHEMVNGSSQMIDGLSVSALIADSYYTSTSSLTSKSYNPGIENNVVFRVDLNEGFSISRQTASIWIGKGEERGLLESTWEIPSTVVDTDNVFLASSDAVVSPVIIIPSLGSGLTYSYTDGIVTRDITVNALDINGFKLFQGVASAHPNSGQGVNAKFSISNAELEVINGSYTGWVTFDYDVAEFADGSDYVYGAKSFVLHKGMFSAPTNLFSYGRLSPNSHLVFNRNSNVSSAEIASASKPASATKKSMRCLLKPEVES